MPPSTFGVWESFSTPCWQGKTGPTLYLLSRIISDNGTENEFLVRCPPLPPSHPVPPPSPRGRMTPLRTFLPALGRAKFPSPEAIGTLYPPLPKILFCGCSTWTPCSDTRQLRCCNTSGSPPELLCPTPNSLSKTARSRYCVCGVCVDQDQGIVCVWCLY